MEIFFVIILGLAFGSFATCMAYRLPLELNPLKPSYCPLCNNKLKAKNLIPLFSWLLQGGKCSFCGGKIHYRYPLIELTQAALFLFCYWQYGFTVQALVMALLTCAILIMIVSDLEHYIIPDEIQIAIALLGIANVFLGNISYLDAIYGFICGLGVGLSLHYGFKWVMKKDGLGFGDVKLLAVLGIWLGYQPFVFFLFLSGVFGVLSALLWRLAGKGEIFPFGPALAVAGLLIIIYPNMGNFLFTFSENYSFMKK